MTAQNDDCSHPETLAFVASGFVHRIGNLIFTIQGHAQLLARASESDRELLPIANAAERSGQALGVMRTLLGGNSAPPANAADLLEVIVEIVRIPVRESGHTLVCALPEALRAQSVDPESFCPAVLETVRRFAERLPGGPGARIELELASGPGETLFVRIDHSPPEGGLPFPLANGQIRSELEAALRAMPRRPRISCRGQGIELAFGGAEPRSATAEQV